MQLERVPGLEANLIRLNTKGGTSRESTISQQLTDEETRALRQKLDELRLEHRDLDDVIHHLTDSAYPDQLQIQRLKKRKLRLKDNIDRVESRLIPDIDA